MSSVLRTVKEVGGVDKYYKVTAIPSFGFPVIRNGVWIKSYNKFVDKKMSADYLIVRDLGSETRVTSIDPLYMSDYLIPTVTPSVNLQFIDYRIVTPGWARKVQLIITPNITNRLENFTNDGNNTNTIESGVAGAGNPSIDFFTNEQFEGPSPTFVGGDDYDMPCVDKGFMKTKYNIFHVITRPLIMEYTYTDSTIRDSDGKVILQKKQWMIKNSMMLTN